MNAALIRAALANQAPIARDSPLWALLEAAFAPTERRTAYDLLNEGVPMPLNTTSPEAMTEALRALDSNKPRRFTGPCYDTDSPDFERNPARLGWIVCREPAFRVLKSRPHRPGQGPFRFRLREDFQAREVTAYDLILEP